MAKGRIPQSDIDAIRERTPIEEIVGEYVQLKPGGADSLKGLSPFKEERTPSFHVRPNHGYYRCFSTDQGGDVFDFLMKMEHVTFPEAVEMCADKIGYRISYQGGGPGRREDAGTRHRLITANKAAHEFYQEQLETAEAKPARDFLLQRGFSSEHAHHFGCGYAPGGWDALLKHLVRKGFEPKELEAAGLIRMGRRGPIDQFHRRLLWPIRNIAGDVIGFGARKLFEDDKLGKYLNTRETMLYKKSSVLFGLDLAKKSIASKHRAVVVEGYTDVMAMHAAGETTAVAACGTAFGEDHLQILRRLMLDDNFFRGELIYTFDGDEAGQKAAMRAFSGEQKFTGQSFVAVAPEGMDPCDLRLAKGDTALRDLIADRHPMFEFVIRSMLNDFSLTTVEGRLQALNRTVPVVAGIRDQALRKEYARMLSGWVGWGDPDEVVARVMQEARHPSQPEGPRRRVRREETQSQASSPREHALPRPNPRDPVLWPQRESLKAALQYPELASSYFDGIPEDAFTHPAYRAIRHAMGEAGGCASAQGEPGVDFPSRVAQNLRDETASSLISELVVEEIRVEADSLEAYIDSALSRLQEVQVGNQIAELKAQLQRMRMSDDQEAYNAIFADIIALEEARRSLNDRAFRRRF
nr:DNA primase [Corynebacterium uropygiale]